MDNGVSTFCFLCFNCNLIVVLVFDNSCTTPNGEQAQCVAINSCPILYDIIYTRDKQKQRFLRESECGSSDYEPMVCCGESDTFTTSTTQKTTPIRIERTTERTNNDLLPDRSSCGFQVIIKKNNFVMI